MIIEAIILSLMITAIYVVFESGMLLGRFTGPIATVIDETCIFCFKMTKAANPMTRGKIASRYIQKPLWDCLPCMASVWVMLLTWSFNVKLMLVVCGINVIISKFINNESKA